MEGSSPFRGRGRDIGYYTTWLQFADNSGVNNDWPAFGNFDFAKRTDILDASNNYLVGGNLTVEVDIQVMLDQPPTWTPANTIRSDMLKLLDEAVAETSDIAFAITNTAKIPKKGKKKGKGSLLHFFYAHLNILSVRCPTLATLAEDCSTGTPISIEGVDPDMFRVLLRFVNGGELPTKDALENQGEQIIRTVDRFGCTWLKLAAEAELASAGITTENAAELILFADGTNCSILKEAAMGYFVKNAQAVMASEGFEKVKESPSILTELMAFGFGGGQKRSVSGSSEDNERDYKRMRVATLRKKLDEKGLDVDGSKEMLVSRLEAAENDVVEVE